MFIGENPIHIACEKNDIAPLVIMPGDPLRAKYIAENFLSDYKLVTSVRNMLGYTGMYNGKRVTVMGSGMGMPSMSIYAFELYHYFDVKSIIRIGTCGVIDPSVNIPEVILCDKAYTLSNFSYQYCGIDEHLVFPDPILNENIKSMAKNNNILLHIGGILTMDVFGPYVDSDRLLADVPKDLNLLGEEMEAFGLLTVAKAMNKKATCMATAVDSKFSDVVISIEDRQTSLNTMIKLALDSIN